MAKYNETEVLIMQYNTQSQKCEDVTQKIQWISEDSNSCRVKYYGNANFYHKSYRDIHVFRHPQNIKIENCVVFHNEYVLDNIVKILKFEDWYKVFFKNNKINVYETYEIKIVEDIASVQKIKNLLGYYKEVSMLLFVENDSDFLYKQLDELRILENSILGKILLNKLETDKILNKNRIIYPFFANISQKEAIEKSLVNDISIIQGPPGTGKTQTILNIVANYVLNNKNVAVLSGNNEAIKNVSEKFEKLGYEFLNAQLGNVDNINNFFSTEKSQRQFEKQSNSDYTFSELEDILKKISLSTEYEKDIMQLEKLLCEFNSEKDMNDAEYKSAIEVPKEIKKKNYSTKKILELLSMIEILSDVKINSFFVKMRLFFKYGLKDTKQICKYRNEIISYLRNTYYSKKIDEIIKEKSIKEEYLKLNKYKDLLNQQTLVSQKIFKQEVLKLISNVKKYDFTKENYKDNFADFVKLFPIVYSTTHSIRKCSGENFLYDCVIIDESSQVDMISAFIALSCAKKVVLVGDNKQLPHVVKGNIKEKAKEIFNNFDLPNCFEYTTHNILECISEKIPDVSITLLNEHYRCDPQIIGFCNKRFYNNELIIKTNHKENNGITIYTHGSHFERNRENEREVDIINQEILPNIENNSVGIIAPYNAQVNLLKSKINNDMYMIDTVHKFQGKEKDEIILSTVSNKVRFYEEDEKIDFLNNPNLINVAISRAKNKLYIVTSEEILKQTNSIIADIKKYYEYYCEEIKIVKSDIFSVFDLMYDDYSPILENMKKKLLKISSFDSENIIATLLKDICKSNKYGVLNFKIHFPLKYVIKVNSLSDYEDIKFVNNINTHCDFIVYSLLDKSIQLVIEVDGSQHNEEIQKSRDMRKDRLLTDAGIKILRLRTTEIDCEEKIISKLTEE